MDSRKAILKGVFGLLTLSLAFIVGTSVTLLLESESVEPNSAGIPAVSDDQIAPNQVPISELDVPSETFSDKHFNGWYGLDRFTGMGEVILISVSREVDDETGKNIESDTNAAIFTTFENDGNEGVYGSAWSEIDSRHVKFRTEKRRALSYKFEGTFFKNKTIGDQDEKLLRGTLIKFRNGKKVAGVTDEFAYFVPHCWH